EGQKRFAAQVRFGSEVRRDVQAIRSLRVAVPAENGARMQIPISQLAQISIEEGPAQISRDRISRRINVEANVRDRDLASFVAQARAAVKREVSLPPGWTMEW